MTDTTTRPEVLFVCIHNAGRSQMAAAIFNLLADPNVVVRSAGTAPADTINPVVVEAMAEIGIDLHAQNATPKALTDAAVQASDIVITMGCGDECPYFPGKRYEDWDVLDPETATLEQARDIRDDIQRRVTELLRDLDV